MEDDSSTSYSVNASVLVSCCSRKKCPQTLWLGTTQINSLTVLQVRSPIWVSLCLNQGVIFRIHNLPYVYSLIWAYQTSPLLHVSFTSVLYQVS